MKALTFHGKEQILYEDIPSPLIESAGDVIVEVKACAICGSDLHPYFEREKGLDHGCAMGHEFVGTVVELGAEVRTLKKGDRVMSPFTVSCGQCYYCQNGLTSRCEHSQLFGWRQKGKGLHGGQAQWVRVPLADASLMKMPEEMPDEMGILLGDILSTGYYGVAKGGLEPGQTPAVIGCGPVGMMAIWSAFQLGAKQVFAIDAIPERLRMAEQWGATALNFKTTDVAAVIREATQGRGVDLAVEAVGSGAATRSAFSLLRPGGHLSAVGVCTDQDLSFGPVGAYDKNLTYSIGRCPARYYMPRLIEAALADADRLTSIFTHRFPLAAGARAYRIFADKKDQCMKVLLRT
ncbi:MAG TPA: alcohol dehydrogenase family protein [Saprospiraceae bacterium]|nr:alcohol dehydrogenase family protein [Saprospiraceae bacterium]